MDKPMIYAILGGLVGAVVALLVSNYSVNNRNYVWNDEYDGYGKGYDANDEGR